MLPSILNSPFSLHYFPIFSPQCSRIMEIPKSWEIPIVPKPTNIHRIRETFIKSSSKNIQNIQLTSTPRAPTNITENALHLQVF